MTEPDDLSFFAPVNLGDLAVEMPTLSRKADIFVKVFAGDPEEAARFAGYSGTPDQLRAQGLKLLRDDKVRLALKNRGTYEAGLNKAIASRDERLAFASAIMRNTDPYGKIDEYGKDASEREVPMPMRMKALEILSKAHGDFSETLNVNHSLTLSEQILESFKDDTPIDVIEAQYKLMKEKKSEPAGDLEGLI